LKRSRRKEGVCGRSAQRPPALLSSVANACQKCVMFRMDALGGERSVKEYKRMNVVIVVGGTDRLGTAHNQKIKKNCWMGE